MKLLSRIFAVFCAFVLFSAFTTSSNMSLKIPSIGDTDYPTSISDTFTLIDQHDHTTNKGVQIPTGGLADNAVTTTKILDGAVTRPKLAALGQQISSAQAAFNTSSTTYVDVTNMTVTITTTGRPVVVTLNADPGQLCEIIALNVTTSTGSVSTKFVRSGTDVAELPLIAQNASGGFMQAQLPCNMISYLDVPAAGTYTYKLQAKAATVNDTFQLVNARLIAYEL